MEALAYIVPWVFSALCVGLLAGFMVGRNRTTDGDGAAVEQQRQTVLKVLVELLGSAERLTSDVACHNTEIEETARHMGDLSASGDLQETKHTLLGQISSLLTANNGLQEDLTYARYHMEDQAQEIDHVRREARIDSLTGAANRKAFDEKMLLLVAGWQRERTPFVLIMADVDLFKRINDAHGHRAGDRVLAELGCRLKEWAREGDFVGRYGGDEFAILLQRTELDVGLEVARNICRRTAESTSTIAGGRAGSYGDRVPRSGAHLPAGCERTRTHHCCGTLVGGGDRNGGWYGALGPGDSGHSDSASRPQDIRQVFDTAPLPGAQARSVVRQAHRG